MSRVAAIDCGTNSIRLLVADVDPDAQTLSEVVRRMEIVRLGEGIDKTGAFGQDALRRTFTAIDGYASLTSELQPERVRFVATSASRDADNRDAFFDGVRQRLGVEPEVISGHEEAKLSFAGAVRSLPADCEPPFLVVDVGGGSTELVMGGAVDHVDAMSSVDVGCVRLTERHFRSDPPLPREVSNARDDIELALKLAAESVPVRTAQTVVALAGSATTVAALALGLWEYDASRTHLARIAAADIHRVCEELLYMPYDKRAANAVIHPGRVDVIAAGSLILSAVVAYTGIADVVVSEHDILDGIAWSMVTDAR